MIEAVRHLDEIKRHKHQFLCCNAVAGTREELTIDVMCSFGCGNERAKSLLHANFDGINLILPCLERVYSYADGFHLYTTSPIDLHEVEVESRASAISNGLLFYSLQVVFHRTASLHSDYTAGHNPAFNKLPFRIVDAISVGRPCGGFNDLFLIWRGPMRGKVYWWLPNMEPEREEEYIAEDLLELFSCMNEDPLFALNEVFCATSRYYDRRSVGGQFVPIDYMRTT